MTIKRTVNGQEMEFELTYQELGSAYREWQNMIDIEDIGLYALDEFERDPDGFMDEYGLDVSLAQEHMDEIVAEFHDRYDYRIDDDAKQEAIIDAIFAVLEDYKKEEEP